MVQDDSSEVRRTYYLPRARRLSCSHRASLPTPALDRPSCHVSQDEFVPAKKAPAKKAPPPEKKPAPKKPAPKKPAADSSDEEDMPLSQRKGA